MQTTQYITDIKQIIISARAKAYTAVNTAMVEAYWLIGQRIVVEEQQGRHRAEYGQEIIKNLSKELKSEFGSGFSERCLREYRQFYLNFKEIEFGAQCAPNLPWSHFRLAMRLTDKNAMLYYITEAAANNWSVRTLDRNISALYYCRINTLAKFYSIHVNLNLGERMTSHKPMTLDEKLDISCRATALRKAGDEEGATRLLRTAPMPPYLAKIAKEKIGSDFLINGGWNLIEAEEEFGSDWLTK